MQLEDDNVDVVDSSPIRKSATKIHRDDLSHTIQYTRWLLDILGVWPLVSENCSNVEKIMSKILIVVCPLSLAFTMVPATLHMILRERNPLVRLMLFGPVGFCFTNLIKFGFLIFHHKNIRLCIDHVMDDWAMIRSPGYRDIMRKNVDVGRNLTALLGIFMYTGGMSYHAIMPLWSGSKTNELNETVRPVVYPGFDIFVNPQSSPTYEIIFFGTCVSAFVRYTVTTAGCNLAAVFVTHACGQIQIVMARLENLVEGIDERKDSRKLQGRISVIIKCHVRILRLTSSIEEVLREICLIEVVASTLIMCLLEYYCMTEWDNSETLAIITYVVLLISLSFNIFIFCHIGELLQEQLLAVAKATYMIEWYRLPGKTGLALVMVIAIANSPRRLTAGGMIELTLRSFGSITKTSLVYLNMLREL